MIANSIIALVFSLITWITFLFLSLASWLLSWVTGPGFISVGFTANEFVTPAWGLVRDLANMGFVIALVAIGLGTALRIGEYRAQKTLPLLIIIALLINFTPVICGVIIDASNIAMNFFLGGGITFEKFRNMAGAESAILYGHGTSISVFEKLGSVLGIIAFNMLGGFIFLLFAFLFAVRYVALWVLVILSPLAFFSYVLPATRRFWNMWWSQFAQWTFIGVVAAFWLYLGEQLINIRGLTGPAPPSGQFGGLSALFAYMIPITFLWMGMLASLSISAGGATAIIGAAEKVKGWAETTAKRKVGARVGALAREKLPEIKPGVGIPGTRFGIRSEKTIRELATTLAKTPTPGTGEEGPMAAVKRTAMGAPYWALRKVGQAMGPEVLEAEKGRIEAAEKEVEKAAVDMVISKFRSAADWASKIGYINRLVKQNDIDEALDKGLSDVEITRTINEAKKYEAEKEMISAMPHLEHPAMQAVAGPRGITVAEAYAEEIFSRVRPARAGQVSRRVLAQDPAGDYLHPEALEAVVRSWDGRHIGKFIETHGREGADAIENTIISLSGAPPDVRPSPIARTWLVANNPRLGAYIQSSAGRQFFTI